MKMHIAKFKFRKLSKQKILNVIKPIIVIAIIRIFYFKMYACACFAYNLTSIMLHIMHT